MSVDSPEQLEGMKRAGRVVAATLQALRNAIAPGVSTAELDGYHADAAVTVAVGEVDQRARRLMAATRAALADGMRAAQPGATLRDVGAAVVGREMRPQAGACAMVIETPMRPS